MPISKLCEGMNKLEISSQKNRVLGYSSKSPKNLGNSLLRRQLSSRKVQRKPEKPLTCTNKEAKSGKFVKNKVKGESLQQQASKKLLGSDETDNSKNNESCEEECESASTVPPPAHDSALDDLESNNLRSRATEKENNNSNNRNENINLESSGESEDHLNANNFSEGERNGDEFIDSDDKENASASNGNRVNTNLKENGRRIIGLHDKRGPVPKKVTQRSRNMILNEGSSGTVMKLKKPKATNPKPFRLRTDERGMLREAFLERRTDSLTPQSDAESCAHQAD